MQARYTYGSGIDESLTDYEQHQQYDLDPLGNRLSLDADGTQTSYEPSNGQRLSDPMHRYQQVNGAELDYDDNGNLLTDGANSYSYDVLNRQISLTTLDSSAEYVYDALGRRVAKVVDGVTTYYLYNAGYQVIEERDAENALQARYSYGSGIDEPLSMERGGNVYYYHRDGLGSVSEVSDQSGNLVERYEYDVYGTPTIFDSNDNQLTASSVENPYLFTGRRFDPESGNYYYRARIYSPELGRFLQTDPLGYVDGLNLYAYVGNNPVNWRDPSGQIAVVDDLAILGLLGAAGIVAASPPVQDAVADAAEYVTGAVKRFPENAANVYDQIKDFFAPDPVMMDEVDDGEDTSSVSPTDDEDKVCEVDPGPGTTSQKKNPKPPKKKRGPDVTKNVYDELKDLLDFIRGDDNVPEQLYNSPKYSPKYPEGFKPTQRKPKIIKDKVLLDRLRSVKPGRWKKIYQDGYDRYGNKIRVHWFEHESGAVFDVDYKSGWSNK